MCDYKKNSTKTARVTNGIRRSIKSNKDRRILSKMNQLDKSGVAKMRESMISRIINVFEAENVTNPEDAISNLDRSRSDKLPSAPQFAKLEGPVRNPGGRKRQPTVRRKTKVAEALSKLNH